MWFGYDLSVSTKGSCVESFVPSMVIRDGELSEEAASGRSLGGCFWKGLWWFS